MRVRVSLGVVAVAWWFVFASSLAAQDLGPGFRKIKEGIYVESAKEGNSNIGIILTQEGVVIVDTGQTPMDAQAVLKAVRKLTPLPVRYVIDTEVHPDHTTGHWVFSPPAIVIAQAGTGEAMKKAYDPERIPKLMEQSPEMREAAQGYKMVTPQIEYRDRMTLHVGERTLELMNLKNVHSEADTAVWLPSERVLFAASDAITKSLNNIRTFVTIPDMLNGIRMMKALNPEVVVPGHGSAGSTQIFDDAERYYGLLIERVGKMVAEGKSLDQIKQDLRMPEYADWINQDRMPTNVEAAYRAVKAGYTPVR